MAVYVVLQNPLRTGLLQVNHNQVVHTMIHSLMVQQPVVVKQTVAGTDALQLSLQAHA